MLLKEAIIEQCTRKIIMYRNLLIAAPCLVLLTACTATPFMGKGTSVMSTRTFAADTPTPSLALVSGKTLTAQAVQTAAMKTDYENATTSIKDSVVSISKNAGGELSFTVNGKSYDFVAADKVFDDDGVTSNYYHTQGKEGADGNPIYYVLNSYSGTIDDIVNGDDSSTVILLEYLDIIDDIALGTSPGEKGFLVVGTETQASALGDFTTKTYNAQLIAEFFPVENFNTTQTRFQLRSNDLSLTANFEDNSITGSATGLNARQTIRGQTQTEFADVSGALLFETGKINGTDFIGAVTLDDTLKKSLNVDTQDISFSGTFYGTEAQAIGGVIKGTTIDEAGITDTMIGGFSSD